MDENEESIKITFEFLDVLNDVAGTHAMSVMGVLRMSDYAETLDAPKPDSSLFIGFGDPNTTEGFAYQRWPIRGLPDRLSLDGPVVRALGQQWLVMVASQWNDNYRKRIADALGIEENELRDVAMADINRMRNDVIHHRGIATVHNSGRCEAFRWFDAGESIHVLPEHVADFMAFIGTTQATVDIEGGGPWKVKDDF